MYNSEYLLYIYSSQTLLLTQNFLKQVTVVIIGIKSVVNGGLQLEPRGIASHLLLYVYYYLMMSIDVTEIQLLIKNQEEFICKKTSQLICMQSRCKQSVHTTINKLSNPLCFGPWKLCKPSLRQSSKTTQ